MNTPRAETTRSTAFSVNAPAVLAATAIGMSKIAHDPCSLVMMGFGNFILDVPLEVIL